MPEHALNSRFTLIPLDDIAESVRDAHADSRIHARGYGFWTLDEITSGDAEVAVGITGAYVVVEVRGKDWQDGIRRT